MLLCCDIVSCFCFFSSRRRHTRCALVTGVQTCALPIYPYLPRVEGVVTNVRAHKAEPTWVQIDVEVEGAETQTFALIPMPWHTGNQLLRYAQYNEGRLSSVIYQDAAYAIGGGDELPAGIDPSERVAESTEERIGG